MIECISRIEEFKHNNLITSNLNELKISLLILKSKNWIQNQYKRHNKSKLFSKK